MDVRPVGGGPAGTNLSGAAGPAAPAPAAGRADRVASAQAIADTFAAAFRELSPADLARVIEPLLSPQNAARLEDLLQAAISATNQGDVTRAIDHLAEFAALDPRRGERLFTEPGLNPVRANVENLLQHMATLAKLDAETRLAQASQLVEASALKRLPGWDAPPDVLLGIATRFLDAGGHANFVRAAELAQAVMDAGRWAPAEAPAQFGANPPRRIPGEEAPVATGPISSSLQRSWSAFRKAAPSRITRLWARAPLLVLLLSWLAIGVVGGTVSLLLRKLWPEAWSPSLVDFAFQLWAIGFLALVLFGFYTRIRNVRF